jgi:hypothetical protein
LIETVIVGCAPEVVVGSIVMVTFAGGAVTANGMALLVNFEVVS